MCCNKSFRAKGGHWLWLLSALVLSSPLHAKPQVDKPNIIFLFADDLGWADVNVKDRYQTPNIDKLAHQSMVFNYAYTYQNCQPSRAALISGQYATGSHNGTYNVGSLRRMDKRTQSWPYVPITPPKQTREISKESTSIFEMLKQQGYQTAWFGKNHGTGVYENLPQNHGIDYNFASSKTVVGKVNGKKAKAEFSALKTDHQGWILDRALTRYAQPYTKEYIEQNLVPYTNGNDPRKLVGTAKHYSDALTDAVVDYLGSAAKNNKPFMAYVPFHAVHVSILPRQDFVDKHMRLKAKNTKNKYARYAGFVEQLDQSVARILARVEELGLADNTLIVFTSDNGGFRGMTSNKPLRNAKGSFYEGGLRVPFMAKWPNRIKPGTSSNQLLHLIDMFPTFAELTGASIETLPQKLDGASLLPILLGKTKSVNRDALYWHFPGYMDDRNKPMSMIHKVVNNQLYKMFFDYGSGKYELYNITADQGESQDLMLAPNKRSLKIVKQLNTELRDWLVSHNAPNGVWRVNGEAVKYPSEDMVSYVVPDQTGLAPLQPKKPRKKN